MALYGVAEKDVDLTFLVRSLEEIELLRLKYENLVNVCEQLLKPWSIRKTVAETDEKATVGTEQERSPPPNFEIELLEKALEKARDVRKCHESVDLSVNPKKTHTTVQKSLQLAKVSYAPLCNPTRSQTHNRKAGNSTKISATAKKKTLSSTKKTLSSAKSHTKENPAHKRIGMNLKLTTSVTGGSGGKDVTPPSRYTHVVQPPETQSCEQPLLLGSCNAIQPGTRASANASTGHFRIQTDGIRLSMPSKYRRLRKAVERVASSFAESPSSSSGAETAQRFCARLAPRSPTAPDHCHQLQMLLARDELKLVVMELTSLTPHELSFNQRQPVLTEVLQIKNKLDLLSEAVRAPLVDSSSCLPTFCFNSDRHLPTGNCSSYSSLKEWQSLSEDGLSHLWIAADRQMLLLCQLLFLPQLEEMDAANEHFIPLLQSVHRLCKLKSPIFVSLE